MRVVCNEEKHQMKSHAQNVRGEGGVKFCALYLPCWSMCISISSQINMRGVGRRSGRGDVGGKGLNVS